MQQDIKHWVIAWVHAHMCTHTRKTCKPVTHVMNQVRKWDWAPGHETGQLKEALQVPEFPQNTLFLNPCLLKSNRHCGFWWGEVILNSCLFKIICQCLRQCCPIKLSVMTGKFYICTVGFSTSHVAPVTAQDWRPELQQSLQWGFIIIGIWNVSPFHWSWVLEQSLTHTRTDSCRHSYVTVNLKPLLP